MTKSQTQSEQLRKLACELEYGDDLDCFRERLGILVRHKPVENPE